MSNNNFQSKKHQKQFGIVEAKINNTFFENEVRRLFNTFISSTSKKREKLVYNYFAELEPKRIKQVKKYVASHSNYFNNEFFTWLVQNA